MFNGALWSLLYHHRCLYTCILSSQHTSLIIDLVWLQRWRLRTVAKVSCQEYPEVQQGPPHKCPPEPQPVFGQKCRRVFAKTDHACVADVSVPVAVGQKIDVCTAGQLLCYGYSLPRSYGSHMTTALTGPSSGSTSCNITCVMWASRMKDIFLFQTN